MNDVIATLVGCCLPFFIIPLLVGVNLLLKKRTNALSQFAGCLTLKPIITIPIGVYAFFLLSDEPNLTFLFLFVCIALGLGFTLIIVGYFRAFMRNYVGRAVWNLLALDTLRWGNTVFLFSFGNVEINFWLMRDDQAVLGAPFDIFVFLSRILALFLPTIFALVAWKIGSQESSWSE